jgi:hypothetical protein
MHHHIHLYSMGAKWVKRDFWVPVGAEDGDYFFSYLVSCSGKIGKKLLEWNQSNLFSTRSFPPFSSPSCSMERV